MRRGACSREVGEPLREVAHEFLHPSIRMRSGGLRTCTGGRTSTAIGPSHSSELKTAEHSTCRTDMARSSAPAAATPPLGHASLGGSRTLPRELPPHVFEFEVCLCMSPRFTVAIGLDPPHGHELGGKVGRLFTFVQAQDLRGLQPAGSSAEFRISDAARHRG